jgi:integrase
MARKGQQLKMRALVDMFLEENEGITFDTDVTRTKVLQKFAKAWDSQSPFIPAQSLTKRFVELWFKNYRKADGTPIAQTTRRTYAAHMRHFLQWGIGAHEFDVECQKFQPGKTSAKPQRAKVWFTDEFFRSAWEKETPYFRGLLAFTCLTLARGNEIVSLKVGDLLDDNEWIRLARPKVDDWDDKLPIVPLLKDELDGYLKWYKFMLNTTSLDPDWYLFPRFKTGFGWPDGKVWPEDQRDKLWGTCKRIILKNADLPPEKHVGLGGHSCRRSMAAELHKRLVNMGDPEPMRTVQGMLGHTDIRMTQVYIGTSSVKEARNRAMRGLDWFGDSQATNAEVLPFPMPNWEEEDNPFETAAERRLIVAR